MKDCNLGRPFHSHQQLNGIIILSPYYQIKISNKRTSVIFQFLTIYKFLNSSAVNSFIPPNTAELSTYHS